MNTVKSSKSIIKRKIITCILTISLVLGSFSFAFASPTTADTIADALGSGWTYSNGLGAPYGDDMTTSWYYIFGRNSLAYLRDLRYQLTGNDYDTHTGTSVYTYINNIYSTLTDTSSGSILYGINQTNTKLSDIYDSIGVGGSGNNVLSKLSALINAVGDISIPDLTGYVSNIDSGVITINSDGVKLTGNALNRLNQIAGYTSWISTIRDTTNRIEAINTTISAISSDTYSELSSLHDDYNNIDWINGGVSIVGYKVNSLSNDYINVSTTGNTAYICFTFSNMNTANIYKFHVPVRQYIGTNDTLNFEFGYIDQNNVYTKANASIIAYDAYNYGKDIYLMPYGLNNNITTLTYVITIKAEHNSLNINPSISGIYTAYISNVTKDYYDLSNFIFEYNILDLFRQAKEMFFDDETLQAKRNNASQTTAVLTEFTGRGQASATANDYGTLSTGVSDVKGGMNTNVSANNAFGIFNNSGGYGFWSADTLQELNQSATAYRSFSKSNDTTGYEYYDNRLEYLLNAMNGGTKK